MFRRIRYQSSQPQAEIARREWRPRQLKTKRRLGVLDVARVRRSCVLHAGIEICARTLGLQTDSAKQRAADIGFQFARKTDAVITMACLNNTRYDLGRIVGIVEEH